MTSHLDNQIFRYPHLLSDEAYQALQKHSQKLNFVDNPSFVFNTSEQKDEQNTEIRKSHTVHVRDPHLLLFLKEQLIKKINDQGKDLKIALARDYVTFIQYEEGGFFDWHRDFEKVVINGGNSNIKEMHLLFCIDAPEEGGELLVEPHSIEDAKIMTLTEVVQQNHCVIFDKMMKHRANEVIKGRKTIMTMDVSVTSSLSEAAGLDPKLEEEVYQVLNGNSSYVSLGPSSTYKMLEKLYQSLHQRLPDKLSEFVPFLQIQLEVDQIEILADYTPSGMIRLKIEADEWYDESIGDYRSMTWLWTNDKLYQMNEAGSRYIESEVPATLYRPRGYGYSSPEWKDYQKLRHIWTIAQAVESGCIWDLLNDGVFINLEEYSIQDNFPNITEPSDLQNTLNCPEVKSLPKEVVETTNWIDECQQSSVGYTYHCNESNYETFDIYYRYGLARVTPECDDPYEAEKMPDYNLKIFREGMKDRLPPPALDEIEKSFNDPDVY
jgi:predicted 2-oxoglutarate/Fe(II)-dependent dioxygenase YbiX